MAFTPPRQQMLIEIQALFKFFLTVCSMISGNNRTKIFKL